MIMKKLYVFFIGLIMILPLVLFSQSKKEIKLMKQAEEEFYTNENIFEAYNLFAQAASKSFNIQAEFGKAKAGLYFPEFFPTSCKTLDSILVYSEENIENLEHFYYFYALSLERQYKIDEAIHYYQLFLETSEDTANITHLARRHIETCENAKVIMKKDVGIEMKILDSKVNSLLYESYTPVVTANGGTMFFTSTRPTDKDKKKKKSKEITHENVFKTILTEPDSGDVVFSKAKLVKELSYKKYNMSVKAVAPDGLTLLLFRGTEYGGYLMISKFDGKKWGKPKYMGYPLNDKQASANLYCSFSADGQSIYFSSVRPGGYGGYDIYKTTQIDEDQWSDPVLISDVINTPYDEVAFYAHSDGKTFYLLSDGHNTMGGYDVFVTTLENGEFTTPQNMGYPLNTIENESAICMPGHCRTAYMSSARKNGKEYIYQIIKKPIINDPTYAYQLEVLSDGYEIRAYQDNDGITFHEVNVVQLESTITDMETDNPIEADVVIKNMTTNAIYTTTKAYNGRFSATLPSGNNYELSFQAKDYVYESVKLDLTDHVGYDEKVMHIRMDKANREKTYNLIVYFDFDKSTLRAKSIDELMRLKNFMNINSSYQIELQGHTDSVGSDVYNLGLSQRRCDAIAKWLFDNGIAKKRIKTIGFGETKPKDTNATPEGRQNNRRVEFKIVKM